MMTKEQLQIKLGNATERSVSKVFRKFGYLSIIIPKKSDGSQPCDIIAMKEDIHYMVDAKHVNNNEVSFPFDRIEPNQISSFAYATGFAKIKRVGFAIYFDRTNAIYWLSFVKYQDLVIHGRKSVNLNELDLFEEVLTNEDYR